MSPPRSTTINQVIKALADAWKYIGLSTVINQLSQFTQPLFLGFYFLLVHLSLLISVFYFILNRELDFVNIDVSVETVQ